MLWGCGSSGKTKALGMAASSFQDLIQHCRVDGACLDREVEREHIPQLSCCMLKWELLAPLMKITPADVDSIKGDNHKEEVKTVSFLEVWKQKVSFKATYRVLVESLLKIERVDDAKGICEGKFIRSVYGASNPLKVLVDTNS